VIHTLIIVNLKVKNVHADTKIHPFDVINGTVNFFGSYQINVSKKFDIFIAQLARVSICFSSHSPIQ